MPKSVQKHAKRLIHDMYLSPSKKEGLKIYKTFINIYSEKYDKACKCLTKDKEVLFAFYSGPQKLDHMLNS